MKLTWLHRWTKKCWTDFFPPSPLRSLCIYNLYRNYYNDLRCQYYCGVSTPSKLSPQKCSLQKSCLWQLLWLTRHTFRPDTFLASPAAQRPRQLCLFKKRRGDVGGKKAAMCAFMSACLFPRVYNIRLLVTCLCWCLRWRVEGAEPQLEASGGRRRGGPPVVLTACRVTLRQGSWEPEWQGSLWLIGIQQM